MEARLAWLPAPVDGRGQLGLAVLLAGFSGNCDFFSGRRAGGGAAGVGSSGCGP